MRGKSPLYPVVISRVAPKDLLGELAPVLAEVYHLAVLVVVDEAAHDVDVAVGRGIVGEGSDFGRHVVVAVELGQEHLHCGTGVGEGAVCLLEILVAVVAIGGHEGSRLLLVVDGLHVDHACAGDVEINAGALELLVEQRDVEAVAVAAGDVASAEHLCQRHGTRRKVGSLRTSSSVMGARRWPRRGWAFRG